MADNRSKLGGLVGSAIAAAYWADASTQELDRRIRELRNDKRDLKTRLDALLLGGDWLRLIIPTVRDALVGLAAAFPRAQAPSVVPNLSAAVLRPDLTAPESAADLSWPPKPGEYNADGRTATAGDLALAFLALTYEEPRAVLQGLTQSQPPSAAAKVQLFRAFQALSLTITGQALTLDEWRAIWERLFLYNPAQTLPLTFAFTGQTADASPQVIGTFSTGKDGIYKVKGFCGLQRDDGLGGSVTVFSTVSKFGGVLTVVRTDRLLAQLAPPLVGVGATFQTNAAQIQLVISGKASMALSWDNHLSIYPPT